MIEAWDRDTFEAPSSDDLRQLASRHPERIVTIDVTNHRGERAWRRILPIISLWGKNDWHKEEQWLLVAFDFKHAAIREYAHASIHEWRRYAPYPAKEGLATPSQHYAGSDVTD